MRTDSGPPRRGGGEGRQRRREGLRPAADRARSGAGPEAGHGVPRPRGDAGRDRDQPARPARETAEPLLPLLPGPEKEPVLCDYLAVGELRPKKLAKLVADLGAETVVLVGHNPDLSAYAGWLLGATETAIELEKGAAALIEFDGEVEKGAGRLGWLVTPGWFMGAVAPVGG